MGVSNGLYPPVEPYRTSRLRVGGGHELYVEETGNPQGKPVVFLHGGPGSGTQPVQRQFFDPDRYRIVLFDQRGCGRSTPLASLEHNTTWDLVADIERIREWLNITKWQVFGGSWGSTLALAYAQQCPVRVSELVLRGIFMLRRSELDWFYQYGASEIFPDAWEQYIRPIPEAERTDLIGAYYRSLTGGDGSLRNEAAVSWSQWEARTSFLITNQDYVSHYAEPTAALAFARIECHYFANNGFFEKEGQLLSNIDRIRHIPAVIVQGRYDVVCPMRSAWDLHNAWPEAEFCVIPTSGHSAMETETSKALITATDRFAVNDGSIPDSANSRQRRNTTRRSTP